MRGSLGICGLSESVILMSGSARCCCSVRWLFCCEGVAFCSCSPGMSMRKFVSEKEEHNLMPSLRSSFSMSIQNQVEFCSKNIAQLLLLTQLSHELKRKEDEELENKNKCFHGM